MGEPPDIDRKLAILNRPAACTLIARRSWGIRQRIACAVLCVRRRMCFSVG